MYKHDREGTGRRPETVGDESYMPIYERGEERSFQKWAKGLDYLLDDKDGVEALKKFIDSDAKEYKEVFNFYFACEGLKMARDEDEDDKKDAFKLIRIIYKKFFEKELNFFPNLHPDIKAYISNIKTQKGSLKLEKHIFDPIQNQMKLKLNDVYRAFLGSTDYIREINDHKPVKYSEFKEPKSMKKDSLSTIKEGFSIKIDQQNNARMSDMVTRELLTKREMAFAPHPIPRTYNYTSYAPNSEANSRVQSDHDPEYLECGGSIYGFAIKPPLPKPKEGGSNYNTSRRPRPLPEIVPSKQTGLMDIPKINLPAPSMKTKEDQDSFMQQAINKLKHLELLQQNNQEIYSRPSERTMDSNGNDSDQDILDNHIKTWDQNSPGIASPGPPIPVRRPINSLDCTNNNMAPPPNRTTNPYATLPRRMPSQTVTQPAVVARPPILPPKPAADGQTVVIYKLIKEEIPTRTRLNGKFPTLKQLKESIMKKGEFRYFCKVETRESFNMFQEVVHDHQELPQFDNKVNCQVAEIDVNFQSLRVDDVPAEVTFPMQKAIYKFSVPRTATLKEFKSCLPVLGNYRYFFKKHCDELGDEYDVIQEEVSNDCEQIPVYEGNVICKIE